MQKTYENLVPNIFQKLLTRFLYANDEQQRYHKVPPGALVYGRAQVVTTELERYQDRRI